MPQSKEQLARYPKDWKVRRAAVLLRAGNACEWCGAPNGQPHPKTGSKVVLTIAHVYDHRPERADLDNLAALCQRCHLKHDRHRHVHRTPHAPQGAWPVQQALAAARTGASEGRDARGHDIPLTPQPSTP